MLLAEIVFGIEAARKRSDSTVQRFRDRLTETWER
jgi:hypothetical protein